MKILKRLTSSLASIKANILSIPILIPTQATFLCLESNMPTRLSYLPPPAMLPMLVGSPSIVKDSPIYIKKRGKINYFFLNANC